MPLIHRVLIRTRHLDCVVILKVNPEEVLGRFLDAAKARKFDVREGSQDLNAYEGAEGILYNKFIFRAG